MSRAVTTAAKTNAVVRPYSPADEDAILQIWNSALAADPIGVGTWRTKVLLDPNFVADGCHVAEARGRARGFLLSLTRQVPFFEDGLQPEEAWITAFGVHPEWRRQGLGGLLLAAALDRLRRLGRRRVTLSTYVPNYITPGADVAAYGPGIAFLTERGFEVVSRPLSMRVELTGFAVPSPIVATRARLHAEDVAVRSVVASDIVPVLDFVRSHFSADWRREAADVLADLFSGDPRQVSMLAAFRGTQVLGYAQHRAERFGPFGVDPALRGRGIGRVLLASTLMEMRKKNFHVAWFLWTGDDAARLYAQCGFREARRFAVLSTRV
ncbi:MAG TPA: GNAT family N-acetyltransferase [Candidatus Limnocylindria bacterium]|jgi:GNAT superfamily N-acetyltransferase|nr:GNAT family N-acetyltransferase [Candidatus Limnocylindria bacterium]